MDRYLGTNYEEEWIEDSGLKRIRAHLSDYTRSVCSNFLEVAGKTHFRKASTPMSKDVPPQEQFEAEGQFASECLSFLGALLWIARCCRPDVAFAVGFVARFSAKWSRAADAMLERILAYLWYTADFGLYAWIRPGEVLHVFSSCDSDHAGCPASARSTSGSCTFLVGLSSLSLVAWSSKRQTCTASSTGEAELVALSGALQKQALPLLSTMEAVTGKEIRLVIASDSSAAIAAAKKGMSTAMRHVKKNHRVSIGVVHDSCSADGVFLEKIDTEVNVSDVFTKALDAVRFEQLRGLLGVHGPGKAPKEPALVLKSFAAQFLSRPPP